nr:MAG TPA: hypothetical protein [Caudoviricetes sp.]
MSHPTQTQPDASMGCIHPRNMMSNETQLYSIMAITI